MDLRYIVGGFLLLILVPGAHADTTIGTINLTFDENTSPTQFNPSATYPLDISFTIQNSDFNADINAAHTLSAEILLSTNDVYDGDETIHTFQVDAGQCDSSDINTGTTCSYSWEGPAPASITSGTVYVLVHTIHDDGTASNVDDAASAPLTLDKDAPTFTTIPILSNSNWTNQDVNLTAACADNAGTCTLWYKLGSGSYTEFTSPFTFTSGVGTVLVKAVDGVHNETAETSLTLQIDKDAPVFTSANVSVSTQTSDDTPTFTLSASDAGSGPDQIFIRCGSDTFATFSYSTDFTGFDIDSGSNGCTTGDGSKSIQIHIEDAANNATSDVSVTITLDRLAPNAPSGLGHSSVNNNDAQLSWSASSDSGTGIDGYTVYRHTSNNSAGASLVSSPDGTTTTVNGLSTCTTYYFWVKAKDNAGNESTEFSSSDTFTTSGCSTNNNNNDDEETTTTTTTGGGGATGGGSGSCTITFDIPSNVYAGDTYTLKATGPTYSNGKFRVTPQGGVTFYIAQSAGNATKWEGSYTIPSVIGNTLAFRFGADQCGTASTTRVIKDPATKGAETSSTLSSDSSTAPEATSTKRTAAEGSTIAPATAELTLSLDKISQMLVIGGFNADNESMANTIRELFTKWGFTFSLHVVPAPGEEGKYALALEIRGKNNPNNGELKIIYDVPKDFAVSATQLSASEEMTVLKDDPLIQFTLNELTEGQDVVITLTSNTKFDSIASANGVLESIKGSFTNPPLLFASGTAKPAPGKEGDLLAGFSGLASGVGTSAPFVIGFLVLIGIIFVSVRVIRSSVPGSENPILRSSSQADRGGFSNNRTPTPSPARKKIWSSGEVRIGEDD